MAARFCGPIGLVLWVALGATGVPCDAAAAGLRRVDQAWLLSARMTAVVVEVAGRPASAGAWVRFGHTRLFGLAALPAHAVAAGWRHVTVAVEAGWDNLGDAGFRDDRGQLRVRVGRRIGLGGEASLRRVRPGPGETLARHDLCLVIGWDGPAGRLGTCDLRLSAPVATGSWAAVAGEPHRRLGVALGGRHGAVALAWETGPDGRPSGRWEALCGLGAGLGMLWHADGASGAVGGGLIWQRGAVRMRTSHLSHPDLGLTHRFELALGKVQASPW